MRRFSDHPVDILLTIHPRKNILIQTQKVPDFFRLKAAFKNTNDAFTVIKVF